MFALCVHTFPLSLDLRVEKAFVSMTMALATLTRISRDEFARPPKLLIVHRTALVAKRATGIMPALAGIVHACGIDQAFTGMPIAMALTTYGQVPQAIKVAPKHRGIRVIEAIDKKLVIGKNAEPPEPDTHVSRQCELSECP